MRFNLKAMLIVVAVLTAFFGYSQWRRQQMRRGIEALGAKHVLVIAPDGWIDWLWQRKPQGAVVPLEQWNAKEVMIEVKPLLEQLDISARFIVADSSRVERAVQRIRTGNAFPQAE